MELSEQSSDISKAGRKNHPATTRLSYHGWWSTPDASCLSRCQKGRDGRTPCERMHGKKPTQKFVPFGEKVLARQITTDLRNRMNPRYQYAVWLGMRNNSAECFIGNADGVFRAREIRRLEPQVRWDTETINSVIGVLWRMTDGKWTVDRPELREDPIPIPPLPFEGARVQRERITKQDITSSVPRLDAQFAMQPKTTQGHRHTQIAAERESKNASELLLMEQRLDRRNEVINESPAKEVRRGEQRKK